MDGLKRCYSCKESKPLLAFSKGQHSCKPCHRASVRLATLRHPETKKRNRAMHMQKELAANRAYKKANKERINVINRNRKARMKYGRYDDHSHADVVSLYAKQKGHCAACRVAVGDKYHVDHVIPLAVGGANDPRNLQILCPPCNAAKGVKHPVEFMQSRGYLL